MSSNLTLPPVLGQDLASLARWVRQASLVINELIRRNTTGAFYVWDDGCLNVPTSTTIDGAEEIVFESPFSGNGTLIVTGIGFEGGVTVALNDVELGTLSDANTTDEILYEVQATNLVDGLNSFKIWSTTSDAGELRRLEVWRNFSRELIDTAGSTAEWGEITGIGKPEDSADVTANHAADVIFRQATAPASALTGWLWIDTDDLRIYRYSGAAWVQISADDALLLTSNAPAEGGADVTSANHALSLLVDDTRNTDELPSVYRARGKGVYTEFKDRSALGWPGTGTFALTITEVKWDDTTGGAITQWYSDENNDFYQRVGAANDTIWGAWIQTEGGADETSIHASDVIHRQATSPSSPQDGWIWVDTDDARVYRWITSFGGMWIQIAADDALLIGANAPAEGGANETESRRSLTDWGPTQTFTPVWSSGFSSAPTGDFSYAVSEDGLWASMWTVSAKTGTSNAGTMVLNNLPAAIRPAGTSTRWVQALGVGIDGLNRVAVGARIVEASNGSAGTVEFATLDSGAAAAPNIYDVTGWATSGTKGLERGLRLVWPMS